MDQNKKRNLIICVAVVLILLVFRMASDTSAVGMDLSGSDFTVRWEEYETVMDLNAVESIELVELPEPGECQDGYEDKLLSCGLWKNEVWGEYFRYCYQGITRCIVIRDGEKTLVLNYESDEATAGFFQALTEYYGQRSWESQEP